MDFKSPTHSPRPPSELRPDSAMTNSSNSDSGLCTVSEINDPVIVPACEPTKSVMDCPAIVVSTNQKPKCDMVMEVSKNFHEMSYEELLIQLRELRQQKRNLRAVLRTFENDFYKKSGRRVEKEDRCNMSSVYHCYKVSY